MIPLPFQGPYSIIAKDVSGSIAGICLNAICNGEADSKSAKTDFTDVISSIKPTEPPNNYDEGGLLKIIIFYFLVSSINKFNYVLTVNSLSDK